MGLDERASVLWDIAAPDRRQAEELRALEARNVGKPIGEARAEVGLAARTFRYYAGAVDKHFGQTSAATGARSTTRCASRSASSARSSRGISRSCSPRGRSRLRSPAATRSSSSPQALTPLTALRLGEICAEAGSARGLVQVLVGSGASVGRAISITPASGKISFTGSTEVGREVMERGAKHFKRLTLELGGKSANLIFADADLDRAAEEAARVVLRERRPGLLRAHPDPGRAPAYDEVVAALVERIDEIVVGDPLDPDHTRWAR